MKSIGIGLGALLCALSLNVSATILPPNNLGRYDDFRVRNISEDDFNKITDHIIAMWQPLAKLHGANLVANKRWNDSTVNASANQSGNTWVVTMYGGLARRPEITQDGFALVVCHELGHHFGGYYFYEGDSWAAAEGQADYFATQVCGKEVFKHAKEWNIRYRMGVPKAVEEKCNAVWKEKTQQELCYREAAGGLSLATLLGALGGGKPSFETPDQSKVGRTNTAHPKAQCRLDTYFSGALCGAPYDLRVIPGKNNSQGNNSFAAQMEAAKYSCFQETGFALGSRPACWFKVQTKTGISRL